MTSLPHAPATVLARCDGLVIDVRTPAEHRQAKATTPHQHIPLDQFDAAALLANGTIKLDDKIYMLCHSGGRATRAAQALRNAGCTNVHVIKGGIAACLKHGLATQEGKAPISIERQVRIAAGLLVVLGVVLGSLLTPGWYALSGLVGAGLVFAGITDWCGMALLLAKAPWNR